MIGIIVVVFVIGGIVLVIGLVSSDFSSFNGY